MGSWKFHKDKRKNEAGAKFEETVINDHLTTGLILTTDPKLATINKTTPGYTVAHLVKTKSIEKNLKNSQRKNRLMTFKNQKTQNPEGLQ